VPDWIVTSAPFGITTASEAVGATPPIHVIGASLSGGKGAGRLVLD
jgi:hypothetical protein